MKLITCIFILNLFLFAGCTNRNTINPSPEVNASLESKFGKDANAKWELSADRSYIAKLNVSGHPVKAYFTENGKWIKTETELISSELPSVIVKTVLGAYKGSSISKSLLIDESGKESVYRLSLVRGGKRTEVDLTTGGVILGTP